MLGRFLICSCLGFILGGCGYRLADSGNNRLVTGQEIWVSFIRNETVSSSAQTVIRRALLDESHAMRGLIPATSEGSAALSLSGTLRSYSSRAISYTAADQIREYRLNIEVDLELRRKDTVTPVWKGTLQAFQDYPANNDLALQRNSEETALSAASHILAQKLLTAVEQSY